MTAEMLKSIVRCTYRCTYHPRGFRDSEPQKEHPLPLDCRLARDDVAPTSSNGVRCRMSSVPSNSRSSIWNPVGGRRGRQVSSNTSVRSGLVLEKALYSVTEAASLLSCSKSTLYEEMKAGRILTVHPRTRARISANAIINYVQLVEQEELQELEARRRNLR